MTEDRLAPGSTGSQPTPAWTPSHDGRAACCRSITGRPSARVTATWGSHTPSCLGSSPTRTGNSASRTATRRPRRAMSTARPWNSRSSQRSSTCPAGSVPCSFCGRYSASRPRRWPRRWIPPRPPSTAPCNAHAGRSVTGSPSTASRPPCDCSATSASAIWWTDLSMRSKAEMSTRLSPCWLSTPSLRCHPMRAGIAAPTRSLTAGSCPAGQHAGCATFPPARTGS